MENAWLAFVGSFAGTVVALALAGWVAWEGARHVLADMDHAAKQVEALHEQLTTPNAAAPPGTPVTPMQQAPKKGK